MENQDVFTPEQESWLEGQYDDLHSALDNGHWAEADSIIKEVAAKEFFAQAADMSKLLSHAKYAEQ